MLLIASAALRMPELETLIILQPDSVPMLTVHGGGSPADASLNPLEPSSAIHSLQRKMYQTVPGVMDAAETGQSAVI